MSSTALLRTLGCTVSSHSVDICPEVELLNHMEALFIVFLGASTLFSIVAVPTDISTNQASLSAMSLPTIVAGVFLTMAVVMGVRRRLTVGWTYASLVTGGASTFSCAVCRQYVFFGVKVKGAQSRPTLRPHGLCSPQSSPGQNTGVGSSHPLLQGIFPIQGPNPALPHCRRIP